MARSKGKTNGGARAPRKRKGEAGVAAEAEAATPVAGRGSKRATSQNPGNGAAPAKTVGANAPDGGRLAALIERIEILEADRKALSRDIAEVYQEAKAVGYDTAVMRLLVRERRLTDQQRAERAALLDVYRHALGMLADLPLGKAALQAAEGAKAP